MRNIIAAASIAASLFAPSAFADGNHAARGHGGHGGASQATSAQAGEMTEGEIRRVDKDAKKITIKHGPLAKFDMPAMTMVFQVKDAAMLDQVKAGDKVRFRAANQDGRYTVTEIQPAK